MSRKLITISTIMTLMSTSVIADVPNVAADIAPIHSLVSRVMDGVGAPKLIVQSGASPHGYRLRPSEAKALQDADHVFWIGEELTPWLNSAIDTLATKASVTTLLDQEGVVLHNFREGALFEAHDHSAHDDDDKDHDDHDKDHDDHGEHDPHAWLSIENAQTWLNLVASKLSAADPENAGVYFANAAAARAEIGDLVEEVNSILGPVRGRSFVAFHDAYQYFEISFDFPASGAISMGDATDPSAARIAEIQDRVRKEGINCVLSEPQYNPNLVATVLLGTDANTGVIDPLGVGLEPGPKLYGDLIRNMAKSLAGCL